MKGDLKTALFVAVILVMFVSSHIFVLEANTRGEEQIWRNAEGLGYIIGYQAAEWDLSPFFDENIYNYAGGEIYNISVYQIVELPGGYYYNNTYYSYNITLYKIDLNLQGFFVGQEFSPYVNPAGSRYVTFRYCKNGPFPGPGHYKFHYFDVDFMEIIHWEEA